MYYHGKFVLFPHFLCNFRDLESFLHSDSSTDWNMENGERDFTRSYEGGWDHLGLDFMYDRKNPDVTV